MSIAKPRILHYSHDTYGLGHLRRTLAIAGQVAADYPAAHQLVVTGSMVAGAFQLPPRLDLVKLPALSKHSNGQYKSRALPLSLKELLAWREQLILQAAVAFKPDLVLVDKVAAGVEGELLPLLRHLRTWSPATRLVLGMRDIEDDPEVTRAEWARGHVAQLHDEVYDAILYYGQRSVFDPVPAYGLSPQAVAKLVECGYLGRVDVTRPVHIVRRELGLEAGEPLVAVTVGGGGDGFAVLSTYLDMLAAWPGGAPFHSLLVTGPLMSTAKRRLLRQAANTARVTLFGFTVDLHSYLAAAAVVVGMAGYNTVCETLALGKPAVLVPRVKPRGEQRLRAERLAAQGWIRMLHPDQLAPATLAQEIEAALNQPAHAPQFNPDLGGLPRASAALGALLAGARLTPSSAPYFERQPTWQTSPIS